MARRDLVSAHTAWRNRAGAPAAHAGTFMAPVIAAIATQLAAIDAEIARVIAASATLAPRMAKLCAIPGVGVTRPLLALMPELGRLDRRAAASPAGLAPHPQQSGMHDGYRRTQGGRPEVKRTLFMAVMSAAQHHPMLGPFHRRLLAAAKSRSWRWWR